MRILHLVHQYLPEQVGGTELYTHWVTRSLAGHGQDVAIFYRRYATGTGLDYRTDGDRQVWAVWSGQMSPRDRFLATFKESFILDAFCQVLDRFQPELVHIQHLMGLPVSLVDQLRQRNLPYVITLHDYWWVCANAQLVTNYSQQLCDGPKLYLNCARCALARSGQPQLWPALPALIGPLAWRNRLLWRVMHTAHKLIAPSEFMRNWYEAQGIPTDKLQLIPHGLDSPPRRAKQTRKSSSLLRFAYIGGLSWQKGVHVLLDAFKGVDDQAELWVAGDESADPGYVSSLRALASPNVRFLGKLTREAVWDTLYQVDVVVVPSMWYEAFSFIVSEAFAAGVPVVASRLGPLAYRVHDGVDGLLVPPDDSQSLQNALTRFFEEPGLLPKLQAGIGPVRTVEEHAVEIEALYKAILLL